MKAIIKKRPGDGTSCYAWHYSVYVGGKVCRYRGFPIEVFSLGHARGIAATQGEIGQRPTHVTYAWTGRTVALS